MYGRTGSTGNNPNFARLEILTNTHSDIDIAASIVLYLNINWWRRILPQIKFEDKTSKPITINVSVVSYDLAILNFPRELNSEISLFGKKLFIPNNDQRDINVNALLQITKTDVDEHKHTIRAQIISGSVSVIKPYGWLRYDEYDWLWPSEETKLEEISFSRSAIQMKIEKKNDKTPETKRTESYLLYQYQKLTRKLSDGTFDGVLWQMVPSPYDRTLETPESIIGERFAEINTIVNSNNRIQVRRRGSESIVYLEIKKIGNIYKGEQFIRVDIEVTIESETNSEKSIWHAKTLKSNTLGEIELLNYDEVGILEKTGEPAKTSKDFHLGIQWYKDKKNAPIVRSIMKVPDDKDKYLIPKLFLSGSSDSTTIHGRFMWQPVDVTAQSEYKDQPIAWLRHSMSESLPTIVPENDNNPVSTGKNNNEFSFKNLPDNDSTKNPWILSFTIPNSYPGKNNEDPLRSVFVFQGDSDKALIQFKVRDPQIRVSSPEWQFYSGRMQESSSVPGGLNFGSEWSSASLQFMNDLGYIESKSQENDLLTAEISVKSKDIELACSYETTTAYLSTNKALIDPISVASKNRFVNPKMGVVRQAVNFDANNNIKEQKLIFLEILKSEDQLSKIEIDAEINLTVIFEDQFRTKITLKVKYVPANDNRSLNKYCFKIEEPSALNNQYRFWAAIQEKVYCRYDLSGQNIRGRSIADVRNRLIIYNLRSDIYDNENSSVDTGLAVVYGKEIIVAKYLVNCEPVYDPPNLVADFFGNMSFLKTPESNKPDSIQFGVIRDVPERDASHGLFPVGLNSYKLIYNEQKKDLASLKFDFKNTRPPETYDSVQALAPWTEANFTFNFENPLGTAQVIPFHRNLVLEHDEYKLGSEFKKSKAKNSGMARESFSEISYFLLAVRDRYCQAVKEDDKTRLTNWLIHAKFTNPKDELITPRLTYDEGPGTRERPYPELNLKWHINDEEKNTEQTLNQSLSLGENGTAKPREKNWLEYDIAPGTYTEGQKLTLVIYPAAAKEEEKEENTTRTVNSYVPPIFLKNSEDKILYYADNLGVVHKTIPEKSQEPWCIYKIFKNQEIYYSVSVSHYLLCHQDSSIGLTQLIFSCDGLIIPENGELEHYKYSDKDFSLGTYGFRSSVTNTKELTPPFLSTVDNWPRFKGIPFYPTRISELRIVEEITENGTELKVNKIVFYAILANPESLSRRTSTQDTPEFISHALSASALIKMEWDNNRQLSIIENSKTNSIDWRFSLADQKANQDFCPGHLVGIKGRVKRSTQDDNKSISINVKGNANDSALVFNRTWSLKESDFTITSFTQENLSNKNYEFGIKENDYIVTSQDRSDQIGAYVGYVITKQPKNESIQVLGVIASYSGRQTTNDESYIAKVFWNGQRPSENDIKGLRIKCYEQTNFGFTSSQLRICAIPNFALEFSLNVNLSFGENVPGSVQNISAKITGEKSSSDVKTRLELSLGENKLEFRKLQGLYYCYTLCDSENTQLGAMVLWIENTIDSSASDDLPYYLAGILIQKETIANYSVSLKSEPQEQGINLSGVATRLRSYIYQRRNTKNTNNWRITENISCILSTFFPLKYRLIVDDQLICDTGSSQKQSFSAILQLSRGSGIYRIQFPIKISLVRVLGGTDIFELERDCLYFAQLIKPIQNQTTQPDVIYPSIKGQSVQKNYSLQPYELPNDEESKRDSVDSHFLSLSLKDDFVFKIIDPRLVPLDLSLEPEAMIPIPRLPTSLPQLIHRQRYGARSRLSLHSFNYAKATHSGTGSHDREFNFGSNSFWMLSSIMQSNLLIHANRYLLLTDELFLTDFDKPMTTLSQQTEALLIFNRPPLASLASDHGLIPDDSHTKLSFVSLHNMTDLCKPNDDSKDLRKVPEDREALLKNRIIETGSSGVAIYILSYPGGDQYTYVSSPYFDYAGEFVDQSATAKVISIRSDNGSVATILSSIKTDEPEDRGDAKDIDEFYNLIDFRLLPPKNILSWGISIAKEHYIVAPLLNVDLTSTPCFPVRQLGFKINKDNVELSAANLDLKDSQLSVFSSESVAFRDMESPCYLPFTLQMGSSLARELSADSQFFYPQYFSISYGPDKPGAMYHQRLRNIRYIGNDSQKDINLDVSPSAELIIRDPQRIKVSGCLTAALTNLSISAEATVRPNISRIRAQWKEVIGVIKNLNSLVPLAITQVEEKLIFNLKNGNGNADQSPIILTVQDGEDLLKVDQSTNSIPACIYPDEKYFWAKMYLISRTNKNGLNTTCDVFSTGRCSGVDTQKEEFEPYVSLASGNIEKVLLSNDPTSENLIIQLQDGSLLGRLEKGDLLYIPNMRAVKKKDKDAEEQTGLCKIIHIDKANNQITIDATKASKHDGTSEFYFVRKLKDCVYLTQDGDKYSVRQLNIGGKYLHPNTTLQVLWITTLNIHSSQDPMNDTHDNCYKQSVHAALFTAPLKVIARIPATAFPKTACVVRVGEENQYCRTLFFGDSALAARGNGIIDEKQNQFTYEVDDAAELTLPTGEGFFAAPKQYYMLKYLRHGQVIHTEFPKEEKTDEKRHP